MHTALLLSLAAFVSYLASAALFVALHVSGTGYSPVRHAMSDYGVGSSRRLFSIYAGVGSAGALALGAALWVAPRPVTPPWLLGVLLAMVAGRIGLALFPTDLEGRRITAVGLLHYACAVGSFAAAYVFVRGATPHLASALWAPARPVLVALGWLALPALVANCVTMLPPLRRVFGLFERLFLATVLLWFTVASGALALTLR